MVVAPASPKVFNELSGIDQLYKRTRTWFGLHAKKLFCFCFSAIFSSNYNTTLAVLESRWLKMRSV